MEREKLESMLIDYIDGNLGEKDRLLIEAELEKNPDAKTLYYQLKEVMVKMGDADAFVSGLTYDYPDVIRPALQIHHTAPGAARA